MFRGIPWWRHQMETFSALLAICAGNSPVPSEFPTQRPVTRSFDVFFDLHTNKRLSKQWWGWWFETLSRPLWRNRNAVPFTQSNFTRGDHELNPWSEFENYTFEIMNWITTNHNACNSSTTVVLRAYIMTTFLESWIRRLVLLLKFKHNTRNSWWNAAQGREFLMKLIFNLKSLVVHGEKWDDTMRWDRNPQPLLLIWINFNPSMDR